MTDLRAAAIQVRTAAQDQHATYDQCVNAIESVLREVVEEAEKNCLSASMKIYKKGTEDVYKEARSEMREQAAKVADSKTEGRQCSSTYSGHDDRWCSACETIGDVSEIISQEIRALKP